MEDNKKLPKTPQLFCCKNCDYKCLHKGDWNKHIRTAKHLNGNNDSPIIPQIYKCLCGNEYNHMSGLSRHRKKCTIKTNDDNYLSNNNDIKEIMKYLIKENSDIKHMMLEQQNMIMSQNTSTQNMMTKIIETGINNTNNSHNITNNTTFNLQFFLNETCKDAMNINEFVSSIKVNLDELENTGRQGYIEGISSIILKRLNKLEQHFRPLHCSDLKREVFYIKENNEWKKENENKAILTKAIKVISNENIKQIKCWRDKYPDCTDADSKKNNLYLKIVSNSMNGSTMDESSKNIEKIISNVAKEVIINKTSL